jgi:predicted ester cyclase
VERGRRFMGKPGSGKPIDAGALALFRTASGRVTEMRAEFDQIGLMHQIARFRTG